MVIIHCTSQLLSERMCLYEQASIIFFFKLSSFILFWKGLALYLALIEMSGKDPCLERETRCWFLNHQVS